MARPDFDVGSAVPAADDLSNTTDILLNRDNAGIDMDKTMVLPPIAKPAPVEREALPDLAFELPAASAPAADKAAETAAPKDDMGIDFKIDLSAIDGNKEPEIAAATAAQTQSANHGVDEAWKPCSKKSNWDAPTAKWATRMARSNCCVKRRRKVMPDSRPKRRNSSARWNDGEKPTRAPREAIDVSY